jgi:hypothetical protein
MANENKSYVDVEFVKSLGTMPSHDIDAVEALYPGTVEKTIDSVSRKFDNRAVPQDKVGDVKRHVAALVVAELWPKRGVNVNPVIDAKVSAMTTAANDWLSNAKTVDEVRKSAQPPPSPLSGEGFTAPQYDPFPTEEKAKRR